MNAIRKMVIVGGFCCLGAGLSAQAPKPVKNLIENGDFTAGASHWQGAGKVEVFTPPTGVPNPAGVAPAPGGLVPAATPAPKLPPLPFATPAPRWTPTTTTTGGAGTRPDGNRVWAVSLNGRTQMFSQRFDVPRQAKLLRVSFKTHPGPEFKTERTTLGAIQARVMPLNASYTFYDRQISAEPKWQTTTLTYTIKAPSRYFDLEIEVQPGSGELYFDDIFVEPLEH